MILGEVFVIFAGYHGDLSHLANSQQAQMAIMRAVFLPSTIVQVSIEAIAALFILVALPRMTHFSLKQLGFRALTMRDLAIALAGAVGMVIVVDGGGSVVSSVMHSTHQELAVSLFISMRSNVRLVLFFAIFAVILQPIAEETIFRVFLFNLGLRYGGFWAGAILSGILFGAAHLDKLEFLPLALGGVVLCAVYYRSRNAYASMISHGLFNALSTALIYFAPKLAGS
jgi:membrane protease YdiL (CAAX protease family)